MKENLAECVFAVTSMKQKNNPETNNKMNFYKMA